MSERRPYRYWEDPAWVADSDPKVVAKLIRNQRDLLDECETLIDAMRQEIQNLGGSLEGVITADATIAKLRAAQEIANE